MPHSAPMPNWSTNRLPRLDEMLPVEIAAAQVETELDAADEVHRSHA
jgi:hypothetical protein